jgi:hypothetical protein
VPKATAAVITASDGLRIKNTPPSWSSPAGGEPASRAF